MSENESKFLTVANLIADLSKCEPEAEVAVMMKGLEVTIPIGQLSKITAEGKPYALLLIAPESVQYAMMAAQEKAMAQEAPIEGELVN